MQRSSQILLTQRLPMSLLIGTSTLLLCLLILGSISFGAMYIPVKTVIAALSPFMTDLPEYGQLIIRQVRIPRTLLAIAIGGLLALCGSVMQALFRNPLADPGIIGVSAGASLGAACAIVIVGAMLSTTSLLTFTVVPLSAFVGGALATFAVYCLGTYQQRSSTTMMLLAGIALSAIAGAGLGILNYVADDQALRDFSLWSLGSLAGANWHNLILAYATLTLTIICCYRYSNSLNALLLGEAEAGHLGVHVQQLKRQLILLCALGVGVAVALAGVIGFIGLVVPHIARQFTGPVHQRLLPISTLFGALLLLLSDLLARTLVAPVEIPVGIITAAIGAPFFLLLLIKQRGYLS
ncbi:FecCD family ABC transporter permease [Serratia microhaemolytica]|uniref:FecCD family ABC transporter permease n=1 Tax=Serratia microhaemolytica TaxID=2675110 RepID=UPI000FDDE50D|nr:iron ABC transporter permease [Serratia microhaemolytica]